MFRDTYAVRDVARHIQDAVDLTIDDEHNCLIEQEPAFTDRLLSRIQDRINGKTIRGIQWKAKTLTDRGRGAQEQQYGADFLGVLNIDLRDYKVAKGFLAQAKKIRHTDRRMSSKEYDKMKRQCERMLRSTPDSFVFLYGDTTVVVVPASSVVAAARCNPHALYSKTIVGFFINYLQCFIGDPRIRVPSIGQLDILLTKHKTRSLLAMSASEPETKKEANPRLQAIGDAGSPQPEA